MKRFIVLLAACLLSVAAFAQTPKEIIDKMEEVMDKLEVDGLVMTMDVKIPILGSMTTRAWSRGDKTRIEGEMLGVKIINFTDGETEWEYNTKENKVRIKHQDASKESQEESNAQLFDIISEGYDVSLGSETATAWTLRCKKSKSNKNKDDPKSIDLVVAKGTYYPVSLSTKVSGISVKMYDLGFNVTEKQVTFDPAEFPGVTIIDER